MRTINMFLYPGAGFLVSVTIAVFAGCALGEEITEPELAGTSTIEAAIAGIRWPIGQQSSPSLPEYLDPATCYHTPGSGAHKPAGGYSNADDTYALDINCSAGSEGGKPVYPVLGGTVLQVYDLLGFVLVQHPVVVSVDGIAYSSFYTGYMHMTSRPSGIVAGAAVTTTTKLGVVSSTGARSVHLHFIAYAGQPAGGGPSTNGNLFSFNPAQLGGPFATFDYTPYIWKRFVDNAFSSATYQLVTAGSPGDIFASSACGIRGSMMYTTSKSAPADNIFSFKMSAPIPVTGGYYVWPFIPRCNGTTAAAPYQLREGTSTDTASQAVVASYTVNQAGIFDDYVKRTKLTIPTGNVLTLQVQDATGEVGKKVAADQVVVFRKADHCLGGCSWAPSQERGYCLQSNYVTSTSTTSCPETTSVPPGY